MSTHDITADDIRLVLDNGCGCCDPDTYDAYLHDGRKVALTPAELDALDTAAPIAGPSPTSAWNAAQALTDH